MTTFHCYVSAHFHGAFLVGHFFLSCECSQLWDETFPAGNFMSSPTAHPIILERGHDVESPAIPCRSRQTPAFSVWLVVSVMPEKGWRSSRDSHTAVQVYVCIHESVSTNGLFLCPALRSPSGPDLSSSAETDIFLPLKSSSKQRSGIGTIS